MMHLSPLIFFIIGFSLWPALEYGLHSGLGHLFLRGKTQFSRSHLRHHAEKDWFAPTWQKVVAAVPVLCLVLITTGFLSNWANAIALTSGFAIMYFIYELVHLRAHTHPPTGPYSRWVRRNHFSHHFQSPRKNHGVTTPFFDYVFGTHVAPDKVKVPERYAMRWLINPDTRDVWPEFQNDYELKKASQKHLQRQNDLKTDLSAAYQGEAPVC